MVEFGAVMEAFERGGKPERVLETFDEMVRGGLVFWVLVVWWWWFRWLWLVVVVVLFIYARTW